MVGNYEPYVQLCEGRLAGVLSPARGGEQKSDNRSSELRRRGRIEECGSRIAPRLPGYRRRRFRRLRARLSTARTLLTLAIDREDGR